MLDTTGNIFEASCLLSVSCVKGFNRCGFKSSYPTQEVGVVILILPGEKFGSEFYPSMNTSKFTAF